MKRSRFTEEQIIGILREQERRALIATKGRICPSPPPFRR
jgi:hypothetical protein